MKTTHQTPVYPQTVEIPEPLEVHPSVSPLAAELLLGVADVLHATPDQYYQAEFTGHARCGTPCCILGHAARLLGKKLPYDENGTQNAAHLGMTCRQYADIFAHGRWPECLGVGGYSYANIKPHHGIARINHFLSTGQ